MALRPMTRDEAIGRALLETDHLGGLARKAPAIVAALEESGYTVVPKRLREGIRSGLLDLGDGRVAGIDDHRATPRPR